MMLTYHSVIEDIHEISEGGFEKKPANPGLFFAKRGRCTFCKIEAPIVLRGAYGISGLQLTTDAGGTPSLLPVWLHPEGGTCR
ncbi:MAG TPA: hypothetical protein VHB47_24635 [Thermoanaerobaculia bacterium]|jgi:hypothetical protein|nr:hypothetical protein [Thermoanaerobaculia bacterium]